VVEVFQRDEGILLSRFPGNRTIVRSFFLREKEGRANGNGGRKGAATGSKPPISTAAERIEVPAHAEGPGIAAAIEEPLPDRGLGVIRRNRIAQVAGKTFREARAAGIVPVVVAGTALPGHVAAYEGVGDVARGVRWDVARVRVGHGRRRVVRSGRGVLETDVRGRRVAAGRIRSGESVSRFGQSVPVLVRPNGSA